MNVLHIVSGDLSKGAARGAYWLHCGLKELGVRSSILTNGRETLKDPTVSTYSGTKGGRIVSAMLGQLDLLPNKIYRKKQETAFSNGLIGVNFTSTSEYRNADIIHLHWINGGFINIKHLQKVNKPIVWTLRDMWPMTGGCHYTMGCEKYSSSCGKCPQLGSNHALDLSCLGLRRKKKYLPSTIKIVGISEWISECAKRSSMFNDYDVRTISNNISTGEFLPIQKCTARKILGLPENRRIVLVGAQSLNAYYKGFDLFLESAKRFTNNPLILFFGNTPSDIGKSLDNNYIDLGFLRDDVSLRLAYSAADVFVAPSRMEAFGKTLAEAMSCETPVVCFDAAGPKDIVDHLVNGYKANPFEPEDLARGVDWVLDHQDQKALQKRAREKVELEFESSIIASKYSELYREILK